MRIRNHKWPMALLSACALLAIAGATLAMPQDSFLQQVVDALLGRPHPALATRATATTMESAARVLRAMPHRCMTNAMTTR
jgi:hypothetical protein